MYSNSDYMHPLFNSDNSFVSLENELIALILMKNKKVQSILLQAKDIYILCVDKLSEKYVSYIDIMSCF